MMYNIRIFLFSFLSVITMNSTSSHAAMLAPHLYKTVFDNGLTAIVKETPGTKVATVQIWVKTGSVYEEPNEAGITHLIEHMIFKGTATRGQGDVAKDIEEKGGRINAYTSYEYTVYHATLSARHWGTALEVLTDAVLHSIFDPQELEKEKKVVLEEIGMREDKPDIKLYQELMNKAYTLHPYRLPIIGTIESVSSFTRDDILKYIAKHYQPENITVVIVGDIQADSVEEKVETLFKEIPKSGHTQPRLPSEPSRHESSYFSLQGNINQSQLALAIPIIDFNHPDMPALDVIASILGDGETSRLYHRLRDELRLVYRIGASAFVPRDPGLLEVSASLDAAHVAPALKAILEEVFKLKYLPVSDEELTRVKRKVESDFVFNLERVAGQARVAGSFDFLTGDPREDRYLERVRTVSRDDLLKVAEKYFLPERIIAGIFIPQSAQAGMSRETFETIIREADIAAKKGSPSSLVKDAYLSGVHTFTLPNGIKLLVREDATVATVGVQAVFPGGLRGETEATNGSFSFISDLLPKGAKTLSAREVALRIADMAGDIRGFNGKNTFGLKADLLASTFEEGMTLFRDILLTPAFDPAEAEKIRAELLDALRHQEDSLSSVAFREFNRLLFRGHPYGLNVAGTEEVIKNLSTVELKKLYEKYARPDRMVLAVAGKVDAEKVRELATELFGNWQPERTTSSSGIQEEYLSPEPPSPPEILSLPRDKEQVHIIIGFLGATLKSADRFPLEVLDTVLSGQSGRLFTELRDNKSLAYSLSSFSLLGLDTGSIGVYMGTSLAKKDDAIQALWQQIFRIRQDQVSAEELQKAKNVIIGNYELGLQTHSSQALEMALNETYGLGQKFGNKYIEEISKVTPEQVLEIARRYLLPENYVLITVGPDGAAK